MLRNLSTVTVTGSIIKAIECEIVGINDVGDIQIKIPKKRSKVNGTLLTILSENVIIVEGSAGERGTVVARFNEVVYSSPCEVDFSADGVTVSNADGAEIYISNNAENFGFRTDIISDTKLSDMDEAPKNVEPASRKKDQPDSEDDPKPVRSRKAKKKAEPEEKDELEEYEEDEYDEDDIEEEEEEEVTPLVRSRSRKTSPAKKKEQVKIEEEEEEDYDFD